MFDNLMTLPITSAIPIINELYYILQYGWNGNAFVLRSNYLEPDEQHVLERIVSGLETPHTDDYLGELNIVFDKITGFTGVTKTEVQEKSSARSKSLKNKSHAKSETPKRRTQSGDKILSRNYLLELIVRPPQSPRLLDSTIPKICIFLTNSGAVLLDRPRIVETVGLGSYTQILFKASSYALRKVKIGMRYFSKKGLFDKVEARIKTENSAEVRPKALPKNDLA